jgi:hypothetical protein
MDVMPSGFFSPLWVLSLFEKSAMKFASETPEDWDRPDWEGSVKGRDWRIYFGHEVRQMWHTFTDSQKQALARQASATAWAEQFDERLRPPSVR